MERDATQNILKVLVLDGGAAETAERHRESELLKSLKKQNVALDHLRRALDGEDDDFDGIASIERDRAEAGLVF
jgi:hypothetical protein